MMRDKEVLEVLAVLDVVQNLDVFKARLAELRTAEKALADQRSIDETLTGVKELEAEAEALVADAKKCADAQKAKAQEFEDEKVQQLAGRSVELDRKAESAQDALRTAQSLVQSVQDQKEANIRKARDLDAREASLAVQRKELETREHEHKQLKKALKELTNG